MARNLPSPPLTSLTISSLQSLANYPELNTEHSPREWFEMARHEADKAVLAQRRDKKEEMFVQYIKACQAYQNVKLHPKWADEKKKDPGWAGRVKDFMETYNAFLGKAKDLKEELKKRPIEKDSGTQTNGTSTPSSSTPPIRPANVSRQSSTGGPEVSPMGSIADRMKLLSGKGMDIGSSSKRISKDLGGSSSAGGGTTHVSESTGLGNERDRAVMNGHSVTGGAGNFGVTRMVGKDSTGESRGRAASVSSSKSIPAPSVPAASSSSSSSTIRPEHPTTAAPVPPPPSAPSTATFTPSGSSSVSVAESSDQPPVKQTPTGSSTKSKASIDASSSAAPVPRSRRSTLQDPISPSLSGPSSHHPLPNIPTSPPVIRQPLPTIPHSPASHNLSNGPRTRSPLPQPPMNLPQSQGSKAASADNLDDFYKAFPTVSEIDKQYDEPPSDFAAFERDPDSLPSVSGLPNMRSNGSGDDRLRSIYEDSPDLQLPDVSGLPDLPNLPSVPTSRPGLPPPPPKPDELKSGEGFGPPSPDMNAELKRPASTANVATLGEERFTSQAEASRGNLPANKPPPPPPPTRSSVPVGITSPPNGHSPILGPPPQPISFPVAQPTPGPSPADVPKPKFPLSNSVDCNTLRNYILNPSARVLLLDVRPEDEFQQGYVGTEYEGRPGVTFKMVWLDPTVILRDGMNSTKLEDALSLSPEAQRKAFENRDQVDIVVVYDSHSLNWPRKEGSSGRIPPLARIWEIIFEHEFSKKLQRNPVLLSGGYSAWVEFIKKRGAMHEENFRKLQGQRGPGPLPNGHAPPSAGNRERERAGSTSSGENKRANRDMPVYQSSQYAKNIPDSFGYAPQSMTGETSYTGRQQPRNYIASPPPPGSSRPTHVPSGSVSSYTSSTAIAPLPQASIHPGPGARRRSDYVDQHNQAYSGYSPRPTIDYPQAHALAQVPQPPPAAQGHALERYDMRPGVIRSGSLRGLDLVAREGDEVRYWNDVVLGLTGLKNLGNTCYMNSTIQCLSATFPFTSYFLDGSYMKSINTLNPLGMKGKLANAFSELLKAMWREDYNFLSCVTFRKQIVGFAPQFSGTDQHDSQEFLSFVLDGLHEDLNRVKHKPAPVEMTPEREAALETLPPEVASEKEWQIYRQRNDSFIVDLFQGQYRNRLECLTCHKTSTTYDTFMYLSLPVPTGRSKVVVQELIDEFVKSELMDKEDAWNCPRCKVPRRATKTLSISRLPPVLLIHLKRFSTQNGVFWDKSETPVIFPVKGLDLSRYLPYRHPTGKEDLDDPRTQIAPFRYDLYGVCNHMGTLSSGHYTAYVKSSKGWQYCEDSRVTKAQEKDVVSRPAYILFYKRIRA